MGLRQCGSGIHEVSERQTHRDQVEGRVPKDQPLARHVEVLDIGRRLLPRHLEHARGHIDPHHRAPPPHVVGQSPGDQARPTSHVQGVLAGRRMRQRDQPLGRLPMEAVGPFVVMGREVVEEGDELRQEVRGGVRAQVRGVC